MQVAPIVLRSGILPRPRFSLHSFFEKANERSPRSAQVTVQQDLWKHAVNPTPRGNCRSVFGWQAKCWLDVWSLPALTIAFDSLETGHIRHVADLIHSIWSFLYSNDSCWQKIRSACIHMVLGEKIAAGAIAYYRRDMLQGGSFIVGFHTRRTPTPLKPSKCSGYMGKPSCSPDILGFVLRRGLHTAPFKLLMLWPYR